MDNNGYDNNGYNDGQNMNNGYDNNNGYNNSQNMNNGYNNDNNGYGGYNNDYNDYNNESYNNNYNSNNGNQKKSFLNKLAIAMVAVLAVLTIVVLAVTRKLPGMGGGKEQEKESDLKIEKFEVSPSKEEGGAKNGDEVVLTAEVSGNKEECTYTFKYLRDNVDEGVIEENTTNNTVKKSDFETGKYIFTVEVKEEGMSSPIKKEITGYQVSCIDISEIKTSIPSGEATVGTKVELETSLGSSAEGLGEIKYKYLIKKKDDTDDKNVKEIDGNENGKATWNVENSGQFEIKVEIYDTSSETTLAAKSIDYEVKESNNEYTEKNFEVYYKGIDNPKIHYQLMNGEWKEFRMSKVNTNGVAEQLKDYQFYGRVECENTEAIKVYFTNDNGETDNANGANYELTSYGIWTVNDGIAANMTSVATEQRQGLIRNKPMENEIVLYYKGLDKPTLNYNAGSEWKQMPLDEARIGGKVRGYKYFKKISVENSDRISVSFSSGAETDDNNGQYYTLIVGKTYYIDNGNVKEE